MEKKQEVKRVTAMRRGIHKVFPPGVWATGAPQRNGWQQVGSVEQAQKVETERVDIEDVEIPVDEEEPKAEELSKDELWEFIGKLVDEGKIKKPHHATGIKKLKAIYDDHKE